MSARNRYRPWFGRHPYLPYVLETGGFYGFYLQQALFGVGIERVQWLEEGPSSVRVVPDIESPTGYAWLFPSSIGARAIITDLKDPE
jgi:hypothetical protein